ncbi:ATP-binding protein [Teichococcus oryzae]|uniref:histidine kinase n=1 Tax=Teichococcus oryzae TaxID=1608942 RepID=A0A5B2TH55_9PROT|nr:ATP-binding protein [Pseudoroseomonas oryzae]KAA2213434.1 response regulator [Pseudoroseomonas oryzae]
MATSHGRFGPLTLGVAALLLGLFGGGGTLALRVMEDAKVQRLAVAQSQEVVELLLDLRGMLFQAVVSRNLMLYGDPGPSRERYYQTSAQLQAGLVRLREEVREVPEQAATVETLARRSSAMMTRLEQTMRYAGRGDVGLDLPMLVRESAAERQGLLQLIERMTTWERNHLAQVNQAYSGRAEQARLIMAGLFGVTLLLGIGLLWLLHRYQQSNAARYAFLEASKRAAEADNATLSASRSRLQSILDHARDPILLVDGANRIRLANNAAAEQFRQPLGQLLGCPVQTLIPVFGRSQGEVQACRVDGSSFPAELSVGRYEQDGEAGCVCVLRDISERRRLNEMKNEFISTVSHELRTPLTSIRAALGLVTGGATGPLPEQAREMLDIAQKNSERLALLVNDILDIEKIEAGRLEFRRERVSARQLLEQAVTANRAYGEEFGVRFEIRQATDTAVYADVQRIQQVLANLLSNAAKFSPAGGVVEVSLEVDSGNATFRVRDHGPGIPAEFRPRIFQRFAQADSSDVRQKGGTGLGLSISRAIVEHHGGQVGFGEAEGGGTVFFFTLPRLVEPARVPSGEPGRRRRVLIIEDDADVARLLCMLLDRDGWDGCIAGNAAEAFAALDRESFDALTLDLMLPDEDGISLFRRLRQRPDGRTLPVVVISATADDGRRSLSGDAVGVADWLDKPIDQGRLRDALRQALCASGGPADILHVEDDDDIRRVVAAVMGDEARMVPARNLAEARAALAGDARFALVVIDLGLPDGSGLELLPDIRALHPPPPVLIFSASDPDAQTASSVAAALVKSRTENETLHHTIRHLIEARPSRAEAAE